MIDQVAAQSSSDYELVNLGSRTPLRRILRVRFGSCPLSICGLDTNDMPGIIAQLLIEKVRASMTRPP